MTPRALYEALQSAASVRDVEAAIDTFETTQHGEVRLVPVGGKPSNRGIIEVSVDPGRSLVERITNGIDAVLEAEYERRKGVPLCRNPREAASAWLNVPEGGLSETTPIQRRALAQRVTIRILPGEGRDSRIVEIRDNGIGLAPEQMPGTILSLNESNKLQKHFLAGTYGQGGSSTFAASKYTLIASRYENHQTVGFTVVHFLDLPPEEFKTGHYVYLTLDGAVPHFETEADQFPCGTQVMHFGYDLSGYPSPVGPNSIYGLLNQTLFDPILPVWLDDRVHEYRRVIKGSRNALNGAVDEGDEERRGPTLSHNVHIFYVTLADFGRVGIEYWVLERPTQAHKRPTAAFVNPTKPIILSLHGQDHAELSSALIRKHAELPYLTQRLVCHIDCNSLSPFAKRALFVSNREDARRGMVYELVQQELVRVLRSDDELARLNNEARELGRQDRDESSLQEIRREVARLLRIHGVDVHELGGFGPGGEVDRPVPPAPPRPPRPRPQPIELHEPPTYIRILWEEHGKITFYPEQRRYIRIETDAHSGYHSANNPKESRINIIVTGSGVSPCGTTPLQAGRMRAIVEGVANAAVGESGTIRVELSRSSLPTLWDERSFSIVERPPARPARRRLTLPPFECRAVHGLEDELWSTLGWPDDPSAVASAAVTENGTLVIYYSTVFPKYANQLATFERRDTPTAMSFTKRYEIWLAVHSLLLYQDQQAAAAASQRQAYEEDSEVADVRERQERCRIAALAALFAAREVQLAPAIVEAEQ